jgi:small multidrug resistance family-3 protein
MSVIRSILLFSLAAVAEIGGAWLIWQGVREHRGWIWMGAGVIALGAYGGSSQPCNPTPTSAESWLPTGGVFVAGSLGWGMALDGFGLTGGTSPVR